MATWVSRIMCGRYCEGTQWVGSEVLREITAILELCYISVYKEITHFISDYNNNLFGFTFMFRGNR